MRKAISFFVTLIFIGVTMVAYSDEVQVGEGTLGRFNSLLKTQVKVDYFLRYSTTEKCVYFAFEGQGLTNLFVVKINNDQKVLLLKYLDKYQAWNMKAMSEGVTLQKEIGSFSAFGMWMLNKEMVGDTDSHDITADFFSQNKKVHQFVLQFPKYTSSSNQFETEQPDELYFTGVQAKLFAKQLTDESIQAELKKASKVKKVSDEFK